ncbi:rpa1, partial [Symbiodinium sp. KB8]
MALPVLPDIDNRKAYANAVARELDCIRVQDIMARERPDGGLMIREELIASIPGENSEWVRKYRLRVYFAAAAEVCKHVNMDFQDILNRAGAEGDVAEESGDMEEAESKQPVEETEENDEEMAAKAAEKAARRYAEADAEDLEALGAESSSEDEAMDGPGEVSKEAAANGNEEDVWKVEKQSGQEGTEKGLKQVPVTSLQRSTIVDGCVSSAEHGWIELRLVFPVEQKAAVKSAVVRSMKGITRSLLTKQRFSKNGPEEDCILTEGVNLNAAWNFSEIIDAKRIYTNDIGAVLRTYGVEAARSAIVREISNVFGVYGISVDNRHLGLIADYMTFSGGYRPMNRLGMNALTSPFLK